MVTRRNSRHHGEADSHGLTRDDPRLSFIVAWSPDIPLSAILVREFHAACSRSAELVIVTQRSESVLGTSRVQVVTALADGDLGARLAQGARAATGDILFFLKDRSLSGSTVDALCIRSARRELPMPLRSLPRSTTKLSVILPAHRDEHTLAGVLAAVRARDLPNEDLEVIVVNDAGGSQLTDVAARFADVVVRLDGVRPYGPAYARNRGFEVATSEHVVFLDSDVRVHTETLRRFARAFVEHPEVSAFVGSYDADPPARGIVSQYRNLMRHFIHQCHAGDIAIFWAGCGAIRAEAFRQAGMFDEWRFRTRQLEDGELGNRLQALGHRIVLYPDIQATHLKRWTLRSMIMTELKDRGVPWVRLGNTSREAGLLADAPRPLGSFRATLAWAAVLLALAGAIFASTTAIVAAGLALLPSVLANIPLYVFFLQRRGFWFAVATAPLDLLYDLVIGLAVILGLVLREAVGDPQPDATTEAFAEVGLKTWPPIRARPSAAATETRLVTERRLHAHSELPVATAPPA